jgi:hypothetical protein
MARRLDVVDAVGIEPTTRRLRSICSRFDRVCALFYTCVTYLSSLVWLQGSISFPWVQRRKRG